MMCARMYNLSSYFFYLQLTCLVINLHQFKIYIVLNAKYYFEVINFLTTDEKSFGVILPFKKNILRLTSHS